MLEETFILSKLPLSFEKGETISIHVLSSFIYILNISVKKQAFLYIYSVRQSKESTFELVWHDPALTVDSYFVSRDGYLFILTANNDLHFYNVVEQEVFLERELLSSEFMELLKYSGFPMKNAQFSPLSLVGNNLVLCSGTRWLLVVTWNFSAKVAKDFLVSCIDLGPSITSITSNKQYIFCLNSYGDILVHKAVDALFLIRLSVSEWLPWKDVDNTTQSHRRMVALGCGHDRMRLALVAATHDQVAILDLAAAFNDAMNLNVDSCSSISSDKSHKTTASSYSATSKTSATSGFSSQGGAVNVPSKQLFNCSVFNDAWSNYLQNLKKTATPGQAQSSSHARNLASDVVKLNLSPDFGEIRKVHATDRGFSVLSRLDASTYLYRLFDSRSGQLKFKASLPSHCEVVALTASDVTIDLLVADNSLRLPLCGAPKHVFLNKLLRCVDESRIALLLEGWDEMRSPLTLLLASVADGHLDNVHLALNLHAQLFKLEASGQEVGEGAQTWEILGALDGVVSDTLKASATNVGDISSATATNVGDTLSATEVDDSSSAMTTQVGDISSATATQVGDTSSATATRVSDKFVRQIRGLQLTHCYRLLSLLDEIAIPMQAKAKAAVLRHKLMECIMSARSALEKTGAMNRTSGGDTGAMNRTSGGSEADLPLPQNSVEWVLWEGMTDGEVLRAGIDRLSAVHCFLAVRRQWTPPELGGARFRELATNAAQHLANNQDLDGAVHLLQHAGYNATEELKNICLTTLNASLRDFLIKNVEDILDDEEEKNYMFLSLVLDVMIPYEAQFSPDAGEEVPKNFSLTIANVKSLSQEQKAIILTGLYFKTWDALLLDKLDCRTCWMYLVGTNRLDLLKLWIKKDENVSTSCPNWPSEQFDQWPITQQMVDWIPEADNCMDSTQRILLDWLACDGLFTSKCRDNIGSVLGQLGRVKLLGKYEQVLGDDLNGKLLQFACEKDMIDLVTALTNELPHVYSKYIDDAELIDKSWLQLWRTFMKVNESGWQQESVLELVVKTANYISNGNMDTYLLSHPFVALAIAILQNKSLVDIEDALSISPLLAVGVQSRDEVHCKKQTSLYALLSGTTAFQTDNLFQWQRKRLTQQESESPFPHFGCSELSAKFGHKQTVQYVDYLHNARPTFAFLQFFQENSRAHGKIPVRMQKRGANVAHGLALRCALERDRDVPSGCVAFIEMLTRSSLPLRVHLAAINAIRHSDHVSHTQLTTTIEGLVSNNPSHAASLLQMLETAIHSQLTDLMTSSEDVTTSAADVTSCLKLWHLPVRLARQHNLPLPLSLPKMAANENRWLLFVLCACIFEYPRPQTMQVLTKFASASLREHLQYALRFEVDGEGHVVKGKLRNERGKGKNEGEKLRNVKEKVKKEGEEFDFEDRMLKSDSEGNVVKGKLGNEREKLGNEEEKIDFESRLLKSENETLENEGDTLDGEANIIVGNEKESYDSEAQVRNDRETFEATRNEREKMKKEGDKIDMMKGEKKKKYEASRNEKEKIKEGGDKFDVLENDRRMFEAEDSNTSLFVQVARHGNNLTNFLTQTRKLESPGLALLSSILEPPNVMASFCEWLVASLPPNQSFPYPSSPLDWTPTDVANLLNHAVSLSFINTLQHGFEIFLADHPLAHVAEFLVDSVVHREFEKCVADLERFKEGVKGLGGGGSENVLEGGESGNVLEGGESKHVLGGGESKNVLGDVDWVVTTAVRLCTTALIRCFPSSSQQHTFLKTICKVELQDNLPPHTSQTDFRLLLSLTEYMMQEGLTLDYTVIYDERSGRLDFEKQLQQLIEARRFAVAHSFATIGALSHARILLVEWRERAKTKMADEFWSGCDAAFLAGNLEPHEAVRFYLELHEGARSQEERYKLLKYALKWVKKLHLSSTNTSTQEMEILLKLYHLYLEDNFNFKLILDDVSFKPLKSAKSGLIDDVTLQWLRMRRPVKQLSDVRMRRLDVLIGKLLDVGDLATVCYLETLYAYKNKDSLLIDGCLGLAEGDFTTDSLPQAYAEHLTNISTSHSVHGLRTSNYRHIKSTSLSLSCYSFQDLEEMTEMDDLNETIDTVCKLSEQVTHGSRITQYITAALRVAEAYHLTYKEVISLDQPLSLLSGGQGCQQLQLARDLLTLAALDDAAVSVLVCQQLVASVAADCCDQLFGCNQLTDVLQLCSVQQLPQLGRLLLKAAALRRPPGDGGGRVADCSRQTVELLILAHSCFTKACNMEGISLVLNMCRKVVDALEAAGKWQLMVRLMTGVGRYTEMRYVFHILKENDQFECILSNTMGKFDGLKSATLDFARGCSSDDNSQGLFTLVALHFGMYADLAAMFHESAAAALHSLKYASPPPDKSRLVRSEHNERCLQSAIDDYSHAAQHFIQAERIGRATRTVARAELVALQLSHLRAVPMGSSQHNLLEGCGTGEAEGGRLAGSYEEACVLVRGGGGVEWCDVIYANVIERGSQSFMRAFMQHHSLTPKLVYQVATRFQLDKMATAAMEKNMKQFVQLIALSDLKYRVCSQLGFKDVLSSQLTGSDHLPYLKDTVWRQGFKAAHHH